MENFKHFSHPHNLSFHKSLEGAQITCTGCNFPCTGTPVYSCRTCRFFLHDQCFNAQRSLNHLSHPDHPLSLFPYPTYPSGSFICGSCNQTGSGLCFCCSICEFDLHIHCAYKDHKHNPNEIQIRSHPNHSLRYLSKPPYGKDSECTCDVCGTICDANSEVYHCDVCGYDAHVGCCNLPEKVHRDDHEHGLALLHVNPNEVYECDVCRGDIEQKHCMYFCISGCDYGTHVQCIAAKVTEKKAPPMDPMAFQLEMFKLQNKIRLNKMALDATSFYRY